MAPHNWFLTTPLGTKEVKLGSRLKVCSGCGVLLTKSRGRFWRCSECFPMLTTILDQLLGTHLTFRSLCS